MEAHGKLLVCRSTTALWSFQSLEGQTRIFASDPPSRPGSLEGVPAALSLSRTTIGNIRRNLFWAFAYNVALIPAGVLYPAFGLLLSHALAAGAMTLSRVFVLGNAEAALLPAGSPSAMSVSLRVRGT
jgi:hypothetical protein